jgi:hypothetical protein
MRGVAVATAATPIQTVVSRDEVEQGAAECPAAATATPKEALTAGTNPPALC